MVLIIGPMAAAMIVAFSYMQPDSPEDMFLGILVIVFTPVYWVAMGLFGTLLPAIADRDARYTLRAGMKKFPVMMLRLFLGPGLSLIVTLGVVSGVSVLLLGVMQIENVALQVILSIIASLVGIFNAALGAAVLCSVYRMVVPAAEPTAAE
ncbi:MAG: hypothetical protein U5N55_11415 [Cypionkella sp.]|nr:hypothetical protein [Cypionkella sp.]